MLQGMKQRNDDSANIEHRKPAFSLTAKTSGTTAIKPPRPSASITRDDLLAFHKQWFWPSNFVAGRQRRL